MRKHLRLILAALTMSLASAANAAVTYDFSGTLSGGSTSFSFTSDDFITSFTNVSAGDLDSCVVPVPDTCNGVVFSPGENNLDVVSVIIGDSSFGFGFALGVLTTPGTHQSIAANSGTLIISESAVPEPETWMMLLVGFGATGFAMRMQRKDTARPAHIA
jgi:hypothetical protein